MAFGNQVNRGKTNISRMKDRSQWIFVFHEIMNRFFLKMRNNHLKCRKPTIFRIYFVIFGLNSTCTHIFISLQLLLFVPFWRNAAFRMCTVFVDTFCNVILHFCIYFSISCTHSIYIHIYVCICIYRIIHVFIIIGIIFYWWYPSFAACMSGRPNLNFLRWILNKIGT